MTTFLIELVIFTAVMTTIGLTTAYIAEKKVTDDLKEFLEEEKEENKE